MLAQRPAPGHAAAKIHTLITLGISIRTKPFVLKLGSAARVGSIPIVRSIFRCLAYPCFAVSAF
jgi:hypothetical protein